MQTKEKIWDQVITPKAIDIRGNLAFGNQDCINSAINVLELGLAEKINFGVVLIWDENQKMWTNFYAWHCWNITKSGQPLDLSLHHWQNIFTQLSPAIVVEKSPREMSCTAIDSSVRFNAFERKSTAADIVYVNGGLTSYHLDLIPLKIKTLMAISGYQNGLTLNQVQNLI